jgi:hypothetical protein
MVTEIAEFRGNSTAWLCRCDCGKKIVAGSAQLKRGEITSCGSRLCRYKALKVIMERRYES